MNIGALIPQVFYDLIARIVPGLIIIASSYIVYRGHEISIKDIENLITWFSGKETSSLILLLSFMLVSYLISFIIDGIYRLYNCIFDNSESYRKISNNKIDEDESNKILINFKQLNNKLLRPRITDNYKLPSISIMYDAIRILEPNAGSRLAKLRSEIHMCDILMTGWKILLAINIIYNIIYLYYNNLINIRNIIIVMECEIFILIALVAIFYRKKSLNFSWRLALGNHWVLISEYNLLGEKNKK